MTNLAQSAEKSESVRELIHDFTANAQDWLRDYDFEQMFRDMKELNEKYKKLQLALKIVEELEQT